MKKLICLLLSIATVLSLVCFVSADDTVALVDQVENGVISSYADSTESYLSPSGGRTATMEAYPKPGTSWALAPSTYTFVMINLGGYSASATPGLKNDVPLDNTFFEGLEKTLQNARNAGATIGLRFRFDSVGNEKCEPDWDNLVQMFVDIRDSGLFRKYSDVMSWCELGTFGAYGEQWGSRFGDAGYSTELIDLYLQIFPEKVPISLRTGHRIASWINHKLGKIYCEQRSMNKAIDLYKTHADVRNDKADYSSKDGKDFSTGNLLCDDLSRLCYYNDGYMGTNWDYGTFSDRENETAFLHAQENATYGGEFSGDRFLQIYYASDYTRVWWPVNAIPEMYYTHLMYLHGGYVWTAQEEIHDYTVAANSATASALATQKKNAEEFISRLEYVYDVIGADSLKGTSVISEVTAENSAGQTVTAGYRVTYIAPGFENAVFTEEIAKAVYDKTGSELDLSEYYGIDTRKYILDHMGYRFIVRSCAMQESVNAGGELEMNLTLDNTGFSKLIGDEIVQIVLSNGTYEYTNTVDGIVPQDWKSMTCNDISAKITIPSSIASGEWNVYLKIVDKNSPEGTKASVRFANKDMFDTRVCANLIGKIKVEDGAEIPGREIAEDTRPAGYYVEDPQPMSVDTNNTFYFFDGSYTFTEDGHYGFSVVFKIDGIADGSSILLNKWYCVAGGAHSGNMLHSFNYEFQHTGADGEKHYGYTFKENGYYIMYCPFYSVGSFQGPSVAGQTAVGSFSINHPSACFRTDDIELNGNNVTITPIALIEGAVNEYSVTFRTDEDRVYSGKYGFNAPARPMSESCQFKRADPVLGLYDGEDVTGSERITDGIRNVCTGWTTKPGDVRCAIGQDYVPLGNEIFYPDYALITDSFCADDRTVTLEGGFDKQGVYYSCDDDTKTAVVGESSGWRSNVTAGANICGTVVIPAKVSENGKTYTVTQIDDICTTGSGSIIIPSTVRSIKDNVFAESPGLIIYGYNDSKADSYAQMNGYDFIAMTDDFEGHFTDVTRAGWYYTAVRFAYKNNMMSGMGEGIFAPDVKTTRAMLVRVLYNLEGNPDYKRYANIFDDVDEKAWYRDAIVWAENNGIVAGMSPNTFAPDAVITREQFAAILYRYAVYKGINCEDKKDLSAFTDSVSVSAWAKDALSWTYSCGYITGMTPTLLSPRDGATRAQMASILMRFCS